MSLSLAALTVLNRTEHGGWPMTITDLLDEADAILIADALLSDLDLGALRHV